MQMKIYRLRLFKSNLFVVVGKLQLFANKNINTRISKLCGDLKQYDKYEFLSEYY